jgi:N-acetylmuramoyl-L-alanine amidase
MRVAVVIGHNNKDEGARNKNYEMSEFRFNQQLAHDIDHNFYEHNMVDEIRIVYRETNYQDLPIQINELNPDLIVSLHCNAFNEEVNGCEMLYYHKSEAGKKVAQIFQNKIVNLFENKDRGIKSKTSEDRGGYLLRYTNAPCIIAEPFFIDNYEEYLKARELFDSGELTSAYCECIDDALKYLREAI